MASAIHGTSFVANGPADDGSPNVGFGPSGFGGFLIGVQGIGTGTADGTSEAVGVLGELAEEFPGPGLGVEGVSATGPGVPYLVRAVPNIMADQPP